MVFAFAGDSTTTTFMSLFGVNPAPAATHIPMPGQ
jgi:hypothetical protein